jgi:hypothetical protein
MVPSARTHAFLAGLTAVAVTGVLTIQLPAIASVPKSAPALIGYIYAGTISSGLETLAVAKDHTVTVVKDTPSPGGDIAGVALLHTKGGLWLYVESGAFGSLGNIYEYSVNKRTGAIARTKAKPVASIGSLRGNNLLAYDGYGMNPAYGSFIYAQTCASKPPCTAFSSFGLVGFRANATTGALQQLATPKAANINSTSISGDRLAVIEDSSTGPGLVVSSYQIVSKTGGLKPIVSDYHLVNKSNQPIGGGDVAAGIGTGIDNLSSSGATAVGVLTGSAIDQTTEAHEGTALAFIPHLLLVGEVGATFGPFLELIAPDGLGSDGGIDLTASQYGLSGGSEDDPRFPETIYQLGAGIYVGSYLNPMVQATDGVGGKGLVMGKKAAVTGTLSVTSMAGFLKPTATKTTIAVKHSGKTLVVSGTVKGGVAGLPVTVTIYAEKGKKFVAVQHKKPGLTGNLHYSAALSKPKAAVCRAVAGYAGNAATAGSSARLTFAC